MGGAKSTQTKDQGKWILRHQQQASESTEDATMTKEDLLSLSEPELVALHKSLSRQVQDVAERLQWLMSCRRINKSDFNHADVTSNYGSLANYKVNQIGLKDRTDKDIFLG
jgi:hypothetical protein